MKVYINQCVNEETYVFAKDAPFGEGSRYLRDTKMSSKTFQNWLFDYRYNWNPRNIVRVLDVLQKKTKVPIE